jgi:hypothetical protein
MMFLPLAEKQPAADFGKVNTSLFDYVTMTTHV